MRSILMIENDADDARRIRDALLDDASSAGRAKYTVIHDTRLDRGLERLADGDVDLVLLDLTLADVSGVDALARLREQSHSIPVVVLTASDDASLEEQLLQAGAQDVLSKPEISPRSLRRAIRYALERQRTRDELLRLSIIDGMTGLYNRRGFLTVAGEYLHRVNRSGAAYFAVAVDVDGLAEITETYGRAAGDDAILLAAEILKHTFRASDILARVDSEQFVVLVTDVRGDAEAIIQRRIELWLEQANALPGRVHEIVLRVGIARGDHEEDDGSLEALIARARHDRDAVRGTQCEVRA
ncbi:MAG: diguanylate cyclase response regulator [Gemmatimonadota bacterium]|nr:diguanylate cyclase response regulator [Gemmatimonadota bacterium]